MPYTDKTITISAHNKNNKLGPHNNNKGTDKLIILRYTLWVYHGAGSQQNHPLTDFGETIKTIIVHQSQRGN